MEGFLQYATFIDRALELLRDGGFLGAITSSTYLNLATFKDLRVRLIDEAALEAICRTRKRSRMDDAAVSAACICIANNPRHEASCSSVFIDIRVVTSQRRPSARDVAAYNFRSRQADERLFLVDPSKFNSMPNKVFSYWVPDTLYRVFSDNPPIAMICSISVGLHTRGNGGTASIAVVGTSS